MEQFSDVKMGKRVNIARKKVRNTDLKDNNLFNVKPQRGKNCH